MQNKSHIAWFLIALASFFGGSYSHPTVNLGDVTQPTIIVQEDAARVIDILTSVDIATSSLPSLLPVSQVDAPVDKTVSASSTLEQYFVNNIVDGNQPALGGTLNSAEIQALYQHIAEEKGILVPQNMDSNGEINIYDEIRTNPDVTTTSTTSNYAENPYAN